MKNDISALGNALVDTVFKVEHSLIAELGLETVSYTHLTLPTKRIV